MIGPEYMELDVRGRASLKKFNPRGVRHWLVRAHEDGTIVMEPAVVLPESQTTQGPGMKPDF